MFGIARAMLNNLWRYERKVTNTMETKSKRNTDQTLYAQMQTFNHQSRVNTFSQTFLFSHFLCHFDFFSSNFFLFALHFVRQSIVIELAEICKRNLYIRIKFFHFHASLTFD